MEDQVATKPFNTISFYSAFNRSGKTDLVQFYRELLQNLQEHFDTFGGNCTLFIYDLYDKLKAIGYDSSVAVYSSVIPSHPQGH